jgi:hypothetical protein
MKLLTVTRERQLPGIFSHQLLKSFQRHNLTQRSVNCLGPGLHTEQLGRLVSQMGI